MCNHLCLLQRSDILLERILRPPHSYVPRTSRRPALAEQEPHERRGICLFRHWIDFSCLLVFMSSIKIEFIVLKDLSSASDRSKLDFTGSFSIFIISAILATTIQAQDFQDVPGDKLVGRNTLPIAFPNISRHTPLISLLFWSAYLSFIWEIDTPARAGFTCLAVVVGLRYYLWRSTKADKLSYFLYNVS